MQQRHLALALLCIGCSGGSFSADEREAASDGGPGDKPAVGVTRDDAGSVEGSDGAPFAGGSGGVAGLDGSGASGSGGSLDGSSGAGSSSGLDGGVTCTTGEWRCSERQPQVCISDFWLDNGSECSSPTGICLNGACVACRPGSDSCAPAYAGGWEGYVGRPQTCDATGSWVVGTECSDATPRCYMGECMACADVRINCPDQIPCCDTDGDNLRCCDESDPPVP